MVRVAELSGITEQLLSKYANGSKKPGLGQLEKLAATTGVNVHWLLTGQGEMDATQRVKPEKGPGAWDDDEIVVIGTADQNLTDEDIDAAARAAVEEYKRRQRERRRRSSGEPDREKESTT